jgi:ribosome-associated protein
VAHKSYRQKIAPMIRINHTISIDERELEETFIRASGPGGQNVNKLSTAVQLRFDVRRSPSLPDDMRARLERLAGKRVTREGVLVITAQRHRTQERNRQDALDRLIELIQRAAVAPVPRRPTKPTKGSRERRLQSKKQHSNIKGLRQSKPSLE